MLKKRTKAKKAVLSLKSVTTINGIRFYLAKNKMFQGPYKTPSENTRYVTKADVKRVLESISKAVLRNGYSFIEGGIDIHYHGTQRINTLAVSIDKYCAGLSPHSYETVYVGCMGFSSHSMEIIRKWAMGGTEKTKVKKVRAK